MKELLVVLMLISSLAVTEENKVNVRSEEIQVFPQQTEFQFNTVEEYENMIRYNEHSIRLYEYSLTHSDDPEFQRKRKQIIEKLQDEIEQWKKEKELLEKQLAP